MLRLLAFIPLVIVIVVLLGVSALTGASASSVSLSSLPFPPLGWLPSGGSWRGAPASEVGSAPQRWPSPVGRRSNYAPGGRPGRSARSA